SDANTTLEVDPKLWDKTCVLPRVIIKIVSASIENVFMFFISVVDAACLYLLCRSNNCILIIQIEKINGLETKSQFGYF
ncbi:MAG: hypothetical protein AAGE96_14940, partial [Cyanobacteria bacterium P01_G01_bin.19]